MNKIEISIITVVLLLLSFTLSSQPILSLDDAFFQDSLDQWYDCAHKIEYQPDLPDKLTIEDIAALNIGWQALSTPNPDWKQNCWLKLPLQNKRATIAELILLLHSDDLTVFLQNEKGGWEKLLGGSLRPRSQWDSRQHTPIFSSPHTLQFELPPNSERILYIKLGVPDQIFKIQPQLGKRSFFLAHSTAYFNRTIFTQSFFHGILWVMLLYHFLIFLMNRDRAYWYYAAYIFSLSLLLFYNFECHYLTGLAEFPGLSRLLIIVGTYAFGFFYTHFLIQFLHQENWRTDLKRLLLRYANLMVIVGVINLVLLLLPTTVFKLRYSYWLLLPVATTGLLGLVYISFQYWRSGNGLARYIAGNNFFMLCGLLVSLGIYYAGMLDWLPLRSSSFWGILFLELTIVLQLLSFSLSLSYKGLETERERTKLKELDQLKSRFFANISHEFRTPLTLILGPIKQLKATINRPESRRQLQHAETYAQKLLGMVNQILDLTKLESGKLQLQPKVFDVVALTNVITSSFQSVAQDRGIQLRFEGEQKEHLVLLDQDKMEQILINLIGNAVKYNKEGGEVAVVLHIHKGPNLKIVVKDTGIGISEEALPYIFQLYYQGHHQDATVVQHSSGIGLALTKELVELQGGSIGVESIEGMGTTFTIEIPLPEFSQMAMKASSLSSERVTESPQPVEKAIELSGEEKAIILVVEDHPDIQRYIQSCLLEEYQLLFAADGEQGLAIARQQVPDLIITDVMMPKMDGFALTHALKNDTVTSHIPIIILTGKSSKASRMEGLRTQADEYLTKPFDAEELRLRIQNLLDNRRKWITHFQQQGGTMTAQADQPKSMEDLFLEKAETVVKEHLSDENFKVEQLGRALQMDRTQLFRKLKAITGQNPSHFIRVIRLQTAYRLLQNRTATVAEIAFEVGFSNTSYFSRTFKAHFGKTPGEVMR